MVRPIDLKAQPVTALVHFGLLHARPNKAQPNMWPTFFQARATRLMQISVLDFHVFLYYILGISSISYIILFSFLAFIFIFYFYIVWDTLWNLEMYTLLSSKQ